MYIFWLRNRSDLESILDELSAIYGKKIMYNIYKAATTTSHSFLYIDLMQTDSKNMFYISMRQKIIPQDVDSESDDLDVGKSSRLRNVSHSEQWAGLQRCGAGLNPATLRSFRVRNRNVADSETRKG